MKKGHSKNLFNKTLGLFGILCLLLSTLMLAGCASTGKEYKPPYKEVLDNWTRSEKVYDGIDLRLFITATYKNRKFRYAYVDRYIEAYRLEENAKELMLSHEAQESDLYNEFFLSVATPDKNLNDLDSKDSVWKLYLEDGSGTGVKLSPVSIKRMDTSAALTSALFPYVNVWSTTYIVRFPKYSASGTEPIPNEKSRYLKLAIVGMLGNGQLIWKMEADKRGAR